MHSTASRTSHETRTAHRSQTQKMLRSLTRCVTRSFVRRTLANFVLSGRRRPRCCAHACDCCRRCARAFGSDVATVLGARATCSVLRTTVRAYGDAAHGHGHKVEMPSRPYIKPGERACAPLQAVATRRAIFRALRLRCVALRVTALLALLSARRRGAPGFEYNPATDPNKDPAWLKLEAETGLCASNVFSLDSFFNYATDDWRAQAFRLTSWRRRNCICGQCAPKLCLTSCDSVVIIFVLEFFLFFSFLDG